MNYIYLKIISLFNDFQSESIFFYALLWTILSFLFFFIFRHQVIVNSSKNKLSLSLLIFFILHICLLFTLTSWIKYTLYLPSTPLALDNIFKLGWSGFLTFLLHIGMIVLYWRSGIEMNKHILILIPRQKIRIILYFILSILTLIPFYFSSLSIPILGIFLFCFSLFLIYDLYLEGEYANLTWTLTWVLFFTFFHTQVMYKFTLDREWKEMLNLSQKLSLLEDKRLVSELSLLKNNKIPGESIKRIYQNWKKGYISNIEYQTNIETELNLSPYISTYYKVSYRSIPNKKIKLESEKFFLSPDNELSYALRPDINTVLLFSLKSNQSKRLSNLMAGNFKDIQNLPDYAVSIYFKNKLLFSQENESFKNQDIIHLSTSNSPIKRLSAEQMSYSSTNKSGIKVIIWKRLGGYAKPLAFFSFTACLSLCLYYLYTLFLKISTNSRELSTTINFKSLGSSIQKSLFILTFSSFCILSLTTLFYFNKSRKLENEKRKWVSAQEIISTYKRRFHGMERQLESISKQHGYDIVYIDGAKKHFKSFSFELPGGIPSISLPKDPSNIKKEEITWRERDLLRIWYPVPDFKDKSATAWIGVYFPNDEKNLSKDAIDFIGAIFSGYLFLLLSISAISIYITHSLTNPLDQLGKHLGNLKIDTSEKITWHKNDEVGQLVYAYNSAIDALWESTEKLRKTEREVAWREMAKQVAHEIKNPLTPMKLSLQYMQRAGKLQPDLIQTLLPNLTTTMMEQINTLDQIATAFSQFASMPSPENIPFNLVELLEQTIEMYRHQIDDGNCLSCSFEESNYPIFADKHQIQRVVNNLLNNAVQAIPLEKEGKINIRLFQSSGQKVRLEIEDNGTGVENETQQKIFSPYFTTKSSGTGLGLAMCKDIIESAGGVIGFQSTKNERTCFWIEMPLYNKNNPLKNKEPLLSFAS